MVNFNDEDKAYDEADENVVDVFDDGDLDDDGDENDEDDLNDDNIDDFVWVILSFSWSRTNTPEKDNNQWNLFGSSVQVCFRIV